VIPNHLKLIPNLHSKVYRSKQQPKWQNQKPKQISSLSFFQTKTGVNITQTSSTQQSSAIFCGNIKENL